MRLYCNVDFRDGAAEISCPVRSVRPDVLDAFCQSPRVGVSACCLDMLSAVLSTGLLPPQARTTCDIEYTISQLDPLSPPSTGPVWWFIPVSVLTLGFGYGISGILTACPRGTCEPRCVLQPPLQWVAQTQGEIHSGKSYRGSILEVSETPEGRRTWRRRIQNPHQLALLALKARLYYWLYFHGNHQLP